MDKYIKDKNFLNNQNYIVGEYFKKSYIIYKKQDDDTNVVIGVFYGFILVGFLNGFFQSSNSIFGSSSNYFLIFTISIIFLIVFYLKYKLKIIEFISAFSPTKKQIILLKSPILYNKNIITIPKK